MLFGNPEVFNNDGENGNGRQSNGGVSGGRRNWEFRARHSSGNRCPCSDGWGTVRASFVLHREDDTLGGRGEQDEESDVEEDRNGGPDELGNKLVLRLGTEEVTRLKVTSHIRSLGSRSGGHNTSRQVERLSSGHVHTSRLSDTTENELGGFGDG